MIRRNSRTVAVGSNQKTSRSSLRIRAIRLQYRYSFHQRAGQTRWGRHGDRSTGGERYV